MTKPSSFLSLDQRSETLVEDKKTFLQAEPFNHIVIDNFLQPKAAEKAEKTFPEVKDEGWIHYIHYNEKKHGLNKMELLPSFFQQLITELNEPSALNYLSELTGIPNLLADEQLEGGGLHQCSKGGFLNIHSDFTVHPHKKNWKRRINLLLYFNKEWQPEFKGELEFWSKNMSRCVKKIDPVFNRCVIFRTDEDSFHGFPEPLECPEELSRKSLALYYFTEEKVQPKKKTTNYKARPGDGIKRVFIFLDKKALVVYGFIKSRLGINDDFISKVLKFFSKKKS